MFLVVMLAAANVTFAADPTPIKIKMMALWQAGTVPFKVFEQFAADVKVKVPRPSHYRAAPGRLSGSADGSA